MLSSERRYFFAPLRFSLLSPERGNMADPAHEKRLASTGESTRPSGYILMIKARLSLVETKSDSQLYPRHAKYIHSVHLCGCKPEIGEILIILNNYFLMFFFFPDSLI